MNILLFGGTGTLSTAVRKIALEEGHNITIFNRGSKNIEIPTEVRIVIGDFKNRESIKNSFSGSTFDVVIDFLSRIPKDIERVYPLFKDRCKQYIFISTACVYRRSTGDFPIREDSAKPNKDWDYNIQKFECEQKLIKLSKQASSFYTIVRPYITYDEERIPIGIAPAYKYHRTIIERIKVGKPMFVWDNGIPMTTVTNTEDFAKAVVGLFLNDKARNEDFHITSDFCYSIKELLEIIYDAIGVNANIISFSSEEIAEVMPQYGKMLKGDRALDAIFDNSKIKEAVPGLSFRVNMKEGMRRILNYYDSLNSKEYDYAFEGQVDRLMKKAGIKCKFERYPGTKGNSKLEYLIYRELPFKYANKLCHLLKL